MIFRSREDAPLPKRVEMEVGPALQKRNDSFISGILKMRDSGELPAKDPRVVIAQARKDKGNDVTRPLSKKGFLDSFDKEMSRQMKRDLPTHVRGRLEAIKKSSMGLRDVDRKGNLSKEQTMRGVSMLSERAFNAISEDGKTKNLKEGRNFFDLAAKGSDEISREGLRKSFGRGLVSDVAREKGMKWTDAASKLGDLGLIGKKDPRLNVKERDVQAKSRKSGAEFDYDEVNSGTAATSVQQLGRSLDDATQTIGNRLNGASKALMEERPSTPARKAGNHFDRAAVNEAMAITSLKAGGPRKEAMKLFALSGANTNKGFEAALGRKKDRILGSER